MLLLVDPSIWHKELFSFLKEYDSYVVAVFGAIIWLIWYLFTKKRKSLSFNVKSITDVFDKSKLGEAEFKIQYRNIEIDFLQIIEIEFTNDGDYPILGNEIIKPITIELGTPSLVYYSLEVNKELNISLTTKASETNVEIWFILLNQKDSFIVKIYSSKNVNPTLNCKIVGINRIKVFVQRRRYYMVISWIIISLLLLFFPYIIFGIVIQLNMALQVITSVSCITLILLFFYAKRYWKN